MSAAKKLAPDPRRDMAKELSASLALKDQLKTILGEAETDALTLKDCIEGETDLIETIDAVIQQIGEDTARVEGIGKFETTLAGRKHRLETRVETLRSMLTNALDILEVRRFERPLATLTLKAIAPKVKVVDESKVPSKFFRTPDPTLSKKDLGDALKARGDELDALNGEFKSTGMDAAEYASRLAAIVERHPPIPGAELDNGGVTIQIRFG